MILVVKEMKDSVGLEIGLSSWVTVTQDMIDTFGQTTGDIQFIYNDPVAAVDTPFGGTIAHGFLLLSLLPGMIAQCVPQASENRTAVNYGIDNLRFISPVRAGSRVRGRFVLAEYSEPRPDASKHSWDVTLEIEGEDKPALVVRWQSLQIESDSLRREPEKEAV